MKNIQGGSGINYDSCQALMSLGDDKYQHRFTVESILDNDFVLLSTDEKIKGTLDGFSWYDSNAGKNYVRATCSANTTLLPGTEYSMFFIAANSVHDVAPIHVEQALPVREWSINLPVKTMMHSWRMKFLGAPTLNKFYRAYGEQCLMMVTHKPDEVGALLNLDKRRMLMLSNETEALHSNWHKVSFFLARNISMYEAELIVDIFNSTTGADKKLNPFKIMVERKLSKDLQNRFFQAMGIFQKAKTELPTVMADFLDVAMSKNGETAIPLDTAIITVSDAFRIPKEKVESTIHRMIVDGTANYRKLFGKDTISMGRMMEMDVMAAQCLADRVDDYFDHDKWVRSFSVNYTPDGKPIQLADEQMTAIQTSISSHTSVITGGPGTGKTTTVKSLIAELKILYPHGRIFLAAPTGKAARRMVEVTGEDCSTLHRMMGMTPDSSPILSSFNNDDTLILDECSMMDINLLTAAVKHAGNRGRVVFIGDANQLESIDTGAIMNDMIMCRHMTVAELLEVQRQAASSDIVSGSYKVLEGEIPDFDGPGKDLHFIEANSSSEIVDKIRDLVENVIPEEYGFKPEDIQILATMKKNEAGVTNLNDKLKHAFNPLSLEYETPSRALGNQIYHVGDRVMQTLNRYDLDIQNGEIGEILEFDESKKKVVLDMGDRIVKLPYDNYPFMTHSWAKTVHKSQGSEYPVVIISMPSDHQYMLYRKSLFTAMTRGKCHVFLVGSKATLELTVKNGKMKNGIMIENASNNARLTHLPFLLAEAICEKSSHTPLRRMAEDSRRVKPPKPVYKIDTDSIIAPF